MGAFLPVKTASVLVDRWYGAGKRRTLSLRLRMSPRSMDGAGAAPGFDPPLYDARAAYRTRASEQCIVTTAASISPAGWDRGRYLCIKTVRGAALHGLFLYIFLPQCLPYPHEGLAQNALALPLGGILMVGIVQRDADAPDAVVGGALGNEGVSGGQQLVL